MSITLNRWKLFKFWISIIIYKCYSMRHSTSFLYYIFKYKSYQSEWLIGIVGFMNWIEFVTVQTSQKVCVSISASIQISFVVKDQQTNKKHTKQNARVYRKRRWKW